MHCTYGQTIAWNGPHGRTSVSVGGHRTPSDALKAAIAMAWDAGWRPPRPWDVHRWGEPWLPRGYRRFLPRASSGQATPAGT